MSAKCSPFMYGAPYIFYFVHPIVKTFEMMVQRVDFEQNLKNSGLPSKIFDPKRKWLKKPPRLPFVKENKNSEETGVKVTQHSVWDHLLRNKQCSVLDLIRSIISLLEVNPYWQMRKKGGQSISFASDLI